MFGIGSNVGYIEILPGIQIKTLNYGKESIMVEFLLKKDAKLPEHNHVSEQTGYLVQGAIRLFVDGKPLELKPGDSWAIISNVPHRAEILEDSRAIEVFSPIREDYMKYVNADDCKE